MFDDVGQLLREDNGLYNSTYDNWYYNPDDTYSLLENVKNSIEKANEYISNYIAINGADYYIVLVFE